MKLEHHPLIRLNSVSSTNDFMESLVSAQKIEHGLVVLADYQSSGKGMTQSIWESEAGKNLLLSVYLKETGLKAYNQFYLSKSLSIAIHDMLTDDLNLKNVSIKWPNDIVTSKGKISGSLIKCSLRNDLVQYAIAGIGININQVQFKNSNATSIQLETNNEIGLSEGLELLMKRIDQNMEVLLSKNWNDIDEKYHQRLLGLQKWMRFRSENQEFDGLICEVAENGRLQIQERNGLKKSFGVKEISLISTQPIAPPTY